MQKASPSRQPAELAPCLGEVCGFLPRPASATCGIALPLRLLARGLLSPAGAGVPEHPAPSPLSLEPRRSRTPGEGSRPSWALVGPRDWVTWSGQIRGLSRAAPAIRPSSGPAGTAGSGVRTCAGSECRLSRPAAPSLPNELHQVGSLQTSGPGQEGCAQPRGSWAAFPFGRLFKWRLHGRAS